MTLVAESDRYNFLILLERELPDHILCYYCKRLHAILDPHWFMPTYISYFRYSGKRCRNMPCLEARVQSESSHNIYSQFSFPAFQMAMKYYRQGRSYSRMLDFLSVSTCDLPGSYSVLPRIVHGSLLLRQQHRVVTAPNQRLPSSSHFYVCPHFRLALDVISDRGWDVRDRNWGGRRLPRHINLLDPRYRSELIQCRYCVTEFRLDFQLFDKGNSIIVFTKWQDLGEGKSPLDYKWACHLYNDNIEWQPKEFRRGSICAAFERKDPALFRP